MATLECNNTQDSYPTENGDSLPEEKSLSIDYSEDLWLANEDSSGPYAQQPNKVTSGDGVVVTNVPSSQPESMASYPNSVEAAHASEVLATSDGDGQSFQEGVPVVVEAGTVVVGGGESRPLEPAANFLNGGTVEQNGTDYNGGAGHESKEFVQLVPAGSFVEGAGGAAVVVGGGEGQDKTFTALMPAAGLGVNGEVPQGFSTMLAAGHPHMVFYGSGETLASDGGQAAVMSHEALTYAPQAAAVAGGDDDGGSSSVRYEQAAQMAEGEGEVVDSKDGIYVAVDNLSSENQSVAVSGNFTVLNPAMMSAAPPGVEGQTFANATSSGSGGAATYHNISTLPFVQNGTFSTQPGYSAAFDPAGTTIITTSNSSSHSNGVLVTHNNNNINNGVVVPSAEYVDGQQSSSSSYAAGGEGGSQVKMEELDPAAVDDDEGEEEEEDGSGAELGEGMEMSEFMCPVCNDPFPDQASLDEHVANHPPPKTFVCQTCGKGFATRRYLKYHRKNHCKRAGSYEGRGDLDETDPNGEVRRFTCNVCSRPFRVLKCMKVHKKKKHGILKEFTCHNCTVTFNSSQELISHPCKPQPARAVMDVATATTSAPVQASPPPLAFPGPRKKKKLRQAKPACDICGKVFADRISVDIHRVKHIEEELYPCDMCETCPEGSDNHHLAVYFRIKFFTDDNQHILEDQKAAVASTDPSRPEESTAGTTPSHTPGTPMQGSATPLSAPATPIYLPATPGGQGQGPGTPASVNVLNPADGRVEVVDGQLLDQYSQYGSHLAAGASGGDQVVNNYLLKQYVLPEGGEATATISAAAEQQQQQQQQQTVLIGHQPQGQPGLVVHQHHHHQQQQQHVYVGESSGGGGGGGAASAGNESLDGSIAGSAEKKKKRSKTHTCDICNKSFGDSAKLELHYKSNHLEDRPFQCDVCDKSFFTKWKLQRHMLSHLEQKPHSCPMCSKSFVERGKLDAHYRTHLGTKPFKCEHCHKAFTVKSQLTIHVRRIHSTDQPFACLECGKAFLWKSGLDKHMRKHTREKPYSCHCGQRYSNKSNLILHMSKVHNETHVDAQAGQ
ncbi:zinc finger protein 316 [Aplysia californica]|uniref:Zinc finger protein 316 n=1 Tax=Aplysia californica TaxID=6500 RepID=A0ABM0JKA1_APLCA|nr:zinc finger protein 316 [Aplysia californica]